MTLLTTALALLLTALQIIEVSLRIRANRS
jgi:hypothetical protein